MSVLGFSASQMGIIAASVISKNRQHGTPGQFWEFHTHAEQLEIKEICKTADEVFDYIEKAISCWLTGST